MAKSTGTSSRSSSQTQQSQDQPRPPTNQTKPVLNKTNKISDPSESVDEVNVPEVDNVSCEFVYNFYTENERIKTPLIYVQGRPLPLDKIARYVLVSWEPPRLSEFETSKTTTSKSVQDPRYSIANNYKKTVSEDDFFNPGYVTYTFSTVDAISQGSNDLENFSLLSRYDVESVYKMATQQISAMSEEIDISDDHYRQQMSELAESYLTLADFPKTSLGLKVTDSRGKESNDNSFLRSITNSLAISMKINAAVIPDIFENSAVKNVSSNLENLKKTHEKSKTPAQIEGLHIEPVASGADTANYLTQPVKLLGYVVERFRYSEKENTFRKERTFFVENLSTTSFVDKEVLYGTSYFYSVKVVAAVRLYAYNAEGTKAQMSVVHVSSRAKSAPVETFEYTPPPEPDNLKFSFDYVRRNLMIHWDMPVNHQMDVKQFQVFRRRSLEEPFELIAQYCFDKSATGQGSTGRYKTGEVVDGNDDKMDRQYADLVKKTDYAIYDHRDVDFTFDSETFESSEYIYAVCSVDAHGMISNYSSQHHVTFDAYKNRLATKIVCDAGSPRQYPNMNLRMDTFKDTLHVEGDDATQMSVYFTPEHIKVSDRPGHVFPVVAAQTRAGQSSSESYLPKNNTASNQNAYYLVQLINLDNQKLQLLKINIKDPQNLTM